MKFKAKYEKSNLLLMSSIFLFSLVTCIFWLILREYIYFSIYLILILIIAHVYYFTYYFIKENYLICKLGLIIIKINYKNIKNIENLKDRVKLNMNNFNINIYPDNIDIFVVNLNSKLTNKNSHNIIDKK